MSAALLDIINNVSFAGWGVVIGGLLAAALSGVIFWQDTTKRSSRYFFLFGLVNGLWGVVYAYFEGAFDTPSAQSGMIMLYLAAALSAFALFLFLYIFADEKVAMPFKRFLALFSPYLLIAGILLFYPDFIIKYQAGSSDALAKMVFGEGFVLYAAFIFGVLVAGFSLLIKKYRESAGIFKTAIRELLIVVSIACSMAVLMSLLSPIFSDGHHDLFWIGHIGVIFLVLAGSLILAKYNFWNIKVISTELFISIIIIVLIAELFLASSIADLIIKTGITGLVVFSSSFLVGSVKREIQSKDRITRLLRDLDLMSKRLKVLDKKKSEFLSIASHHLRDPLTAIKGYASMLAEGSFGELSSDVKNAVEKIFVSSGHLITMISDFMDISRIESGDMNYNFTDVDMKKLVYDLVDGMKQGALRAHLGLHLVIDDKDGSNASFITVGDAGKLRQVVSNLIDNSIKYTPSGDIYVALSKSADGKKILFSLTDTGIGMSELTKEKIFHKFSRADGVSKVYTEGTGLGLYVAKEIVKKHEGRIWAESRGEGTGSSFYVELEAKH